MGDWIQDKINDIEHWLYINEKQVMLPTMDEESALFNQEIEHKKEMLNLLHQFRNHPLKERMDFTESFGESIPKDK
jgi:hypothetical protein